MLFEVYLLIKRRVRLFFWGTTIVLTLAIGVIFYGYTGSIQNVWPAFLIGPGIMLLVRISFHIKRYEDTHGLTHHKYHNGGMIHTTFPMKKDSFKQ
jgi:hypothetical protein